MKVVKENGGYFIEDVVLKSAVVNEGKIKDEVASLLESLAEKQGWTYKRDEQTFFIPNGDGKLVPFMILSEQRAYIRADKYKSRSTQGIIKKLYQEALQ